MQCRSKHGYPLELPNSTYCSPVFIHRFCINRISVCYRQCLNCIIFTRNGLNSNPARDSPLLFSAMSYNTDSKVKSFKDNAPKTQFYAVDRDTNRPVLFWSLGVITSVFLSQPCTESGRPSYRGVHAVLQRWERERLGAFFSMLFRNIHLRVQIDGNSAYVYQTRFQSTSSSQKTSTCQQTDFISSYLTCSIQTLIPIPPVDSKAPGLPDSTYPLIAHPSKK